MQTTLSSLQTRVAIMLMKADQEIFDAETITEGIRLALGDYQLACLEDITIAGLDEETETNLNRRHDYLIVMGGAAYALLSRAAFRAESFEMGSRSADLRDLGRQWLADFTNRITSLSIFNARDAEYERARSMRESSNQPWGNWSDPDDVHDPQDGNL